MLYKNHIPNNSAIPMISIAMPAYNAGKYIEESIKSIISQTYTRWELIICDDGSTDNTIDIINKYQQEYPNIKLIKRIKNSGSARLPRFDAILIAEGDYVCPIDSDDTIETRYLEKLIKRQKETGSDIVLGKMVCCDQSLNPIGRTIPIPSYDTSAIISGREGCKRTIGKWEIALNGLLSRTSLYKSYIERYYKDTKYNSIYLDELDQRRLLMEAKSISMTNAEYFYRQHSESVVHSTRINSFRSLITNKDLLLFVIYTFKEEKDVLQKMYNDFFYKIYRAEQRFQIYHNTYSKEEIKEIDNLIKTNYHTIKEENIKFSNFKFFILSKSFFIFRLYIKVISIIIRLKY